MKNRLVVALGVICGCLYIATMTMAFHTSGRSDAAVERGLNSDVKKMSQKAEENYLLPKHVVPTNYRLRFTPVMGGQTFTGEVIIDVNINEATDKITLHSNHLVITSVEVKQENDLKAIKSFDLSNDDKEFLNIYLDNNIPEGIYEIRILFEGRLDGSFVGFYGSTLKNGESMVASKFEPTYARQAFPCFDEPDFKATYDITLVKPVTHIALSNMNEISREHDSATNTDAVTFATSVPMSTYLACFVICDFISKETVINSNGIGQNFTLRSFAQKDQTHKIDFALDIGKRATEYYISYYQVPFPLPKLDMIAIPDYVSGATEHWGLITYRETSFLIDEATASAANKISVANTIAHELAHMWFGNLVTMKWWDELWLNEGFATYMQVKALNSMEPSWTMLDQFLTRTLHSVLITDAKLSSHPIVQTVTTPDQITAIFDSISYNKGASVLRMLEGFVGEENFQKGVTDYLKKYEYGNTITQNLLDALEPYFKENNPSLDITYIMDTWTKQMGYPLVDVQHGDTPNTFTLTQKRFLLDPEAKYENNSPYKYRWFIPITFKTDKEVNNEVTWFPDSEDKVTITLNSDDSWFKINNNQVGYYRVNYPEDIWLELLRQLQTNPELLSISDRAHLLNDAFALAEAQVISYELALNLTTYLSKEDQYVPWSTAATLFGGLNEKLLNSEAHGDFLKYIQGLLGPLYKDQKWEKSVNEDVIQTLFRTRILSLATTFELPEALSKSRTILLNWLNADRSDGSAEIEPDIRSIVYFYGMEEATTEEWDKLWSIYLNEEDAQEQAKLRQALAAPRNTKILENYLTLAWDESNIRSQDYLNVVTYISDNPSGTDLVWDHVRSHWPDLVERFTLNSRYLGNLIPSITNSFDTQDRLAEIESFFAKYPEAGAGATARSDTLETVRNNIKWTQHHAAVVADWLRGRTTTQ